MSAEDDLINKLKNYRDLKRGDFMRAGAALPGTFASGVREGPTAAHNYAQSFKAQGHYSGMDPEAAWDMREKLIDDLITYQKDRGTEKSAYQTLMSGKKSPQQQAMEAALDTMVNTKQASATVAASANGAIASISNARAGHIMDALAGLEGASGGKVAENVFKAFAGEGEVGLGPQSPDAIYDPSFVAKVGDQLAMALTPADKAKAVAAITAVMNRAGIFEPLQDVLAKVGAKNPELANQAAIMGKEIAALGPAAAELLDQAAQVTLDTEDADMKDIARGIGDINQDKLMDLYNKMLPAYLAQDPEKGAAVIGEVLDGEEAANAPKPTPEKIEQLLKDLDQPQEFIPATGREAKQQIINSPQFQEWKKSNGLLDDDTAFKAFRQHFGAQIRMNRTQDAQAIQRIQREGAVMPKPAAPTTTPQYGKDPNTGAIYDTTTGKEVSDDEAEGLVDKIGEMPDYDPASAISFKDPGAEAKAEPMGTTGTVEAPPAPEPITARKPAQLISDLIRGKRKPRYSDPTDWTR